MFTNKDIGLTIKFDDRGLRKLQRESPEAFRHAMEIAAIQFLTWCNTGSAKESRTPPIRFGVLRGSSSAFVGSKHVGTFQQQIKGGATEQPDPNLTYNGDPMEFVVGWNQHYAAKMHEWSGDWGPFTKQAKNAGNKWLEMHIKADKDDLIKIIAAEVKKRLGT